MQRPRRVLGDYYQLLLRHGLLADQTPLRADLGRKVALVACDSQKVVPGTLFLCKGAAFKGRYLSDALQKGAFAYVSERPYPEGGAAPCIRVTDIRTAMGLMVPVIENSANATERARTLRDLERMIDRVGWLVSTLLKVAKVDAGAFRVQKARVDAARMAHDALSPLAAATISMTAITRLCPIGVIPKAIVTVIGIAAIIIWGHSSPSLNPKALKTSWAITIITIAVGVQSIIAPTTRVASSIIVVRAQGPFCATFLVMNHSVILRRSPTC